MNPAFAKAELLKVQSNLEQEVEEIEGIKRNIRQGDSDQDLDHWVGRVAGTRYALGLVKAAIDNITPPPAKVTIDVSEDEQAALVAWLEGDHDVPNEQVEPLLNVVYRLARQFRPRPTISGGIPQ